MRAAPRKCRHACAPLFVKLGGAVVLLLGSLVWLSSPCYSQQETNPPLAVLATAATTSVSQVRDPFWPVDYMRPMQPGERPDTVAKISEIEWRTLEKSLRESVRGVSRLPTRNGGDAYTVLINGKLFTVGDGVSLMANGKAFHWRITSITIRDGPVFERVTSASPTPPPAKN